MGFFGVSEFNRQQSHCSQNDDLTPHTMRTSPTTLDDVVAKYYAAKENHPHLAQALDGIDEELVRRGLDVRDEVVRRLGGVPRLEKAVAPVNCESNDLYQFRMASVYYEENPEKRGSFVMYYRNAKDMGGVLLAGIQHALDTAENFKLDPRFLHKLLSENKITPGLYKALLSLDKLDVDIEAIEEGEFVGPNTPVLTVSGPLWQVQLLETALLQCTDYATGVATRAAALNEASGRKPLIDFGARRAPGEQAAVLSAFSSVKGGAVAVANTLTSYLSQKLPYEEYIDDNGTTSHSYTESYLLFDSEGNAIEDPAIGEERAYTDWIKYFPEITTVLIDTIDKEVGLKTTAKIFKKLGLLDSEIKHIKIRDDSNINADSVINACERLKELGVKNFTIVLSDNLNPNKVAELREGVIAKKGEQYYDDLPIGLGVGTCLARPEPVGFVFKLAEWEMNGVKVPVSKRCGSIFKASFPVATPYRVEGEDGEVLEDLNLHPDEDPEAIVSGTSSRIRKLAYKAMSGGRKLRKKESSKAVSARWKEHRSSLPERVFGQLHTTYRPRFSSILDGVRTHIQESLAKAAA